MISALTWNSINTFGLQAVQLIIGIILARLLLPENFGEIGVLFIFIGIGTMLTDGGFGQALIRKQNTEKKDFSTIFFFNLFISIFIYLILYFSAHYIANFFSLPHIVTPARILFLSIIFFSFYIIQQIILTKELQYKSLAIINILSIFLSGTFAVFLAVKGFGIWALVVQQLFFHVFKSIITPFFSNWKPYFVFSTNTIKDLWTFSIPLLGQTTLNVIFSNIYHVLIGRFFPIRDVGFFTQANKYSETVNAASQNIIYPSTFPIFSKIQDNPERLRAMYRRLTTSIIMISFPVVSLLIVIAKPLIVTLISDKWLPSVPLFQLLVFANLFTPIYLVSINLLNARGESKNVLRLEVFKKSLIVISIFVCIGFGIKALLIGFAAANFIAFGALMIYLKKSISHYFRHQILDILPMLIIAGVCAAAVFPLNLFIENYLLFLIAAGIIFIGVYMLCIRLFFPSKFEYAKNALANIINKFRKRAEYKNDFNEN